MKVTVQVDKGFSQGTLIQLSVVLLSIVFSNGRDPQSITCFFVE